MNHIDIQDILEEAGLETPYFNPIPFTLDIEVTVIGSCIPAVLWGDNAHPAEMPEVEVEPSSEELIDEALALCREAAPAAVQTAASVKKFRAAARLYVEDEIEKACNRALQDY